MGKGHTLLALIDTFLQYIHSFFSSNTIIPPFIHCTKCDIDPHTMSSIWYDSFRPQVIDPIKVGEVGSDVVTGKKKVDGIWTS